MIYPGITDIGAFISLAAMIGGTIPYVFSVLKGHTRPHVFSWTIWAILTGIAFATQRTAGAGIGAWTMGLSFLGCAVIAGLAVFRGERRATWGDRAAFMAALFAIPLWLWAPDPLWAVMLVTLIDALGFYPTYRKSWEKPFDEYLPNYALVAVSFGFSLAAIESKTVVTLLYPAMLTVFNGWFVVMCLLRRRKISGTFRRPG